MHQRKGKRILVYFFLLLFVGSVNNINLSKIKKSVWSCVVSYEDVNLLAQQYCISHSVKRFDGFHLTIVCEHKPVPNAINIEASLEDAFLFYTHSKRQGATNVLELSA